MPLTLSGTLVDIVESSFTDRQTGEVQQNFNAEILHKQGGRHEVDSVKVDKTTVTEWHKLRGKKVSVEVRPYAVLKKEGGIMQGYSLVDKKALPNIIQAATS